MQKNTINYTWDTDKRKSRQRNSSTVWECIKTVAVFTQRQEDDEKEHKLAAAINPPDAERKQRKAGADQEKKKNWDKNEVKMKHLSDVDDSDTFSATPAS